MKKPTLILLTILLTFNLSNASCPRPYVAGPRTLCGNLPLTFSYYIENNNPLTASGIWTVTVNGTIVSSTTTAADVSWTGVGTLIYEGYDSDHNFLFSDTVKIQPCCTSNLTSDWKITDLDDKGITGYDVATKFGSYGSYNPSNNTVTVSSSVGFVQGMMNLSHTNIAFNG